MSGDGGTGDVEADDCDGEEEDEGAEAVEAGDTQIFRRRKHGQCRYATIGLVLQSSDTPFPVTKWLNRKYFPQNYPVQGEKVRRSVVAKVGIKIALTLKKVEVG